MADRKTSESAPSGACQICHCAGRSLGLPSAFCTMACLATPGEFVAETVATATKEAADRSSSVVAAVPFFHRATALLERRWAARGAGQAPRRTRRPVLGTSPVTRGEPEVRCRALVRARDGGGRVRAISVVAALRFFHPRDGAARASLGCPGMPDRHSGHPRRPGRRKSSVFGG